MCLKFPPSLFSPSHFPGNVIVYGNKSDVYTTVEALLSLGISGRRIYLVQPPLMSNVTAINNNAIEKAVDKVLSEVGVSVHHDSLLAQWNDGSYPDPIVQATFTTKTKPFRLSCSVSIHLCCFESAHYSTNHQYQFIES